MLAFFAKCLYKARFNLKEIYIPMTLLNLQSDGAVVVVNRMPINSGPVVGSIPIIKK
jgi:hypothetical protein